MAEKIDLNLLASDSLPSVAAIESTATPQVLQQTKGLQDPKNSELVRIFYFLQSQAGQVFSMRYFFGTRFGVNTLLIVNQQLCKRVDNR